MAKNSLPDSLELLLDTMCNTFGGIIFLAFSIALMLFSSKHFQQTEPIEKIDEHEITSIQQEIKNINDEIKNIKIKHQSQQNALSELSEAMIAQINALKKMEKILRNLNSDIDHITKENAALTERIKKENIQIKENAKTTRQIQRTLNYLQQKESNLKAEISELEKIPIKKEKISFARKRETSLKPYWIIITNGKYYPLGTDYNGNYYVSTHRFKKHLILSPKRGIPITKTVSYELESHIQKINRGLYFCDIFVDPKSYQEFIILRRYLRSKKLMANYFVSDKYILTFSSSVSHEASF